SWALLDREPEPKCAIDEAALAGSWDDQRRTDVHAAFAATGLSYAEPSFELVAANLDDWRTRWLAASRDACEATHVAGMQSQLMLDARTACLDRRRAQLEALVDVLAAADVRTVARVGELLERLPELGACSDPSSL